MGLRSTIFGKGYGISSVAINTFIGGVASNIPDATTLATILQISVSNISDFSKAGSDIKARIDISYSIPGASFRGYPVSYYLDLEAKISSVEVNAFENCPIIKFYSNANFTSGLAVFKSISTDLILELNGKTSLGINLISPNIKTLYIPNVLSIGNSVLNEGIFNTISGATIYVNKTLETINSGGKEGDLVNAETKGNTVVFINNQTKPSDVTNLNTISVYANYVELSWSAPASFNTISFYEIYVDGIFKKKVTTTNAAIYGLKKDATYKFSVKPVDIYYNKGGSNVLFVLMDGPYNYPIEQIISYWKFENNVQDSVGTNNGTAFNLSYSPFSVGNGAVFNGVSSYINVNDVDNLTFPNTSFSFTFAVSFNSTVNQYIFGKDGSGSLSAREYFCRYYNGEIAFIMLAGGVVGVSDAFTPIIGKKYIFGFSYIVDAVAGTKTLSLYQDGILIKSVASPNTGMLNTIQPFVIGREHRSSASYLNGKVDSLAAWGTGLIEAEMEGVFNVMNEGNEII